MHVFALPQRESRCERRDTSFSAEGQQSRKAANMQVVTAHMLLTSASSLAPTRCQKGSVRQHSGQNMPATRRTKWQWRSIDQQRASELVATRTANKLKSTLLTGACLGLLADASVAYATPFTDAISKVCDPFLCPGGNPAANPGFQVVMAVWVVPQVTTTPLEVRRSWLKSHVLK